MIHLHCGADDLGRIRFAFSPVWEAVTSLRTLTAGSGNSVHAPWLRQVRKHLQPVDLELLTALVPPTGYIPDFLHPVPPKQEPSFDTGLAEVAATDPHLAATELSHLAHHRIAQRGAGSARHVEILGELIAAPQPGLVRIVTELERYWHLAIAPYWQRIHALLEADLTYRLQELAGGGLQQLFRTLHPSVSFDHDTLRIRKYYEGHADLHHRGLVLMPCAFAWPDVIVRTADPQPAVTYSPRGLGRLWETDTTTDPHPLTRVLGRTRAAVLAHLDLPMSTTQLACQLDLTAPTLNMHLKTLKAAGIVSAHRDARVVLYHRTTLGDQLLNGAEP